MSCFSFFSPLIVETSLISRGDHSVIVETLIVLLFHVKFHLCLARQKKKHHRPSDHNPTKPPKLPTFQTQRSKNGGAELMRARFHLGFGFFNILF